MINYSPCQVIPSNYSLQQSLVLIGVFHYLPFIWHVKSWLSPWNYNTERAISILLSTTEQALAWLLSPESAVEAHHQQIKKVKVVHSDN